MTCKPALSHQKLGNSCLWTDILLVIVVQLSDAHLETPSPYHKLRVVFYFVFFYLFLEQ